MKGTALIFRPGNPMPEVTELDATPKLEFMKAAVGGWIEAISAFGTFDPGDLTREAQAVIPGMKPGEILPCAAFCNEEGKLQGQLANTEPTRLWDRALRRVVEDGKRQFPNGLFRPDGTLTDYLVGPVLVLIGDDDFMEEL
jgi:hypothetical protein